MAACLEGLMAELCEAAGDMAKENGAKRIKPRHIMMSVKADAEMSEFFGKAVIQQAGVIPNLHPALEVTGKKKKGRKGKTPEVKA